MTITVQELIKKLQGFPESSVIRLKDEDDLEFFIISFIPRGAILNIIISVDGDEEEPEDEG